MKKQPQPEAQLTCLDLFCGAGGKSLGFEQAGFHVVGAIDKDGPAITTFKKNFEGIGDRAIAADIRTFTPAMMAQLIDRDRVDVIIGGPPCQGFSNVRRRDGKNHGDSVVEDSRRTLYQEFLKYVMFFQPKVFVMENVLGLKTAVGGKYYENIRADANAIGYTLQEKKIFAADYGVPQKRRRIFFIGLRADLPQKDILLHPTHSDDQEKQFGGLLRYVTLGEAIMDLPPLQAGGGEEIAEYDGGRRNKHIMEYGTRYLYDVLEVGSAPKLTAHRARPHSKRDLKDFEVLSEGENSKTVEARGIKMQFPYSRKSFHDRYTRQHRNRLCSTIVAHLSKDGLMFIHPTQNRSLTPREAARVQSFPDWFEFPVARTEQFRQIGNAVPPLVAMAVGLAVRKIL